MKNNLVIELENRKLNILNSKIYNKLHSCELLEKRLELMRHFMAKKYNCDYVGLHLFNSTSDIFFSNINHDIWHEFYWENCMHTCPTLKISSQLKKGENGFLFFFDYKNIGATVRAEIVGCHRDGFTVMFHNDKSGNKAQFSITFKDNKGIEIISPQVFNNILHDLKNMENIIDDFMEYFTKYGVIDNSKNLEQFIDNQAYRFNLL